MSVLDRKYMLRLDLSKQKNNTEMEFSISDNQTSDFSVKITHKGKPVDLTDVLGLLVVTKPSGKVDIAQGQIIETSSVYFNLQNNCKDEVGIYSAYVVLGHTYQDIIDDKDRVLLGQITYVVNNDTVQELQPLIPGDDNFQIMIDIITRLQELESNENARILAEQLRVQAEQARVAEHNSMIETFDTKVQEVESTIASVVATEQGIKEAEAIRVTSENTRINNETDRQHAETDRVVAEKKRVVEHDSMMDSTTVAIANINSTDASIKEAESKRVLAEQDRVDAENIREQAIEKVKTDIVKLINDTNKKIDDYKLEKDTAIQQDLEEYKSTTTQDIQDYKVSKDTEINKSLSDYKTSTTQDVEDYKNTKNAEIDKYKSDKDLEIDNYISSKNAELDKYVTTKNTEIDNYKNSKDTLINNKLEEVDTAEQSRVEAEQQRVTEHADREAFLNSFESQLGQIETKNVEQDNRLGKVEYTNKRQDVMLNGLFNENADGRLTIEGEGNNIKLEGSKEGLVEVGKVVGNTLVNLVKNPIRYTETDTVIHSGRQDLIRGTTPNQSFTVLVDVEYLGDVDTQFFVRGYKGDETYTEFGWGTVTAKHKGWIKVVCSSKLELGCIAILIGFRNNVVGNKVNDVIVLEGDYTNKPIPAEYFEGMKSTFEDKLVTQEMVDSGLEKAENLGKYKADIKVVGKNKFHYNIPSHYIYVEKLSNGYKLILSPEDAVKGKSFYTERVSIKKHTKYIISAKIDLSRSTIEPDTVGANIDIINGATHTWISGSALVTTKGVTNIKHRFDSGNCDSIRLQFFVRAKISGEARFIDIQIEEDPQPDMPTTPSLYEPYKEFNQSLYLDEPLLKGDEICVQNSQLGVLHKVDKETLDGSDDENWKLETTNTMTSRFFKELIKAPSFSGSVIIACDKYSETNIYEVDAEGFMSSWGGVYIRSSNKDLNTFKQELQANPITVVYKLAEPIFVPILENTPQWILDSYNSCTVHFETNVPILSSSFKYTGGIPSVMVMDRSISDLMYSFAYISKALNILGGEEV